MKSSYKYGVLLRIGLIVIIIRYVQSEDCTKSGAKKSIIVKTSNSITFHYEIKEKFILFRRAHFGVERVQNETREQICRFEMQVKYNYPTYTYDMQHGDCSSSQYGNRTVVLVTADYSYGIVLDFTILKAETADKGTYMISNELLGESRCYAVFVYDETSACSPSCLNSMETPMQPACNETSGECLYGCIGGYAGAQCLIPCGEYCVTCNISDATGNDTVCYKCENGYYGTECYRPCNTNCLVNFTSDLPTCDMIDGNCTFGCKDRYYGPRCDRYCSSKCQQLLCERDGVCSIGCIVPFLGGPQCYQVCPKGCAGRDIECDQHFTCVHGCRLDYWGPSCEPCNKDCRNSTSPGTEAKCSVSDGFCQFGCSAGKYGHTCSETCPRQCQGATCNRTTGKCLSNCNKGHYGDYCNNTCSSNCHDNDCYHSNGTCIAADCLISQYAWYGPSCEMRCPRNCKDKVCDRETGYCLDGCINGFSGNLCDLAMPSTTGTPLIAITQTYSRNYTPVAVAGGVVGAALLVMILVFVVLLKKDDCGAMFKSSTVSASENVAVDVELQNTSANYEDLGQRNNATPTYDELNLASESENVAVDVELQKTNANYEDLSQRNNATPTYDELNLASESENVAVDVERQNTNANYEDLSQRNNATPTYDESNLASESENVAADVELQNTSANYEDLGQRNNATSTYDELNLGAGDTGSDNVSKTTGITTGKEVYENTRDYYSIKLTNTEISFKNAK